MIKKELSGPLVVVAMGNTRPVPGGCRETLVGIFSNSAKAWKLGLVFIHGASFKPLDTR
jgi:hypothetical protein